MSRSFTSYSEWTVNILNESMGWVIYMVGLSMDGVEGYICHTIFGLFKFYIILLIFI